MQVSGRAFQAEGTRGPALRQERSESVGITVRQAQTMQDWRALSWLWLYSGGGWKSLEGENW